jgi:hypothetical protein
VFIIVHSSLECACLDPCQLCHHGHVAGLQAVLSQTLHNASYCGWVELGKFLLAHTSIVNLGSEFRRTHDHILLSHNSGSHATPLVSCVESCPLCSVWQTYLLTAELLLALASTVILGSKSHGTHDHILLSDSSGSLQATLLFTGCLWHANFYHLLVDQLEDTAFISSLTVVHVFVASEMCFDLTLSSKGHVYNMSMSPRFWSFWFSNITSHCSLIKTAHSEKLPGMLLFSPLLKGLPVMYLVALANGVTMLYLYWCSRPRPLEWGTASGHAGVTVSTTFQHCSLPVASITAVWLYPGSYWHPSVLLAVLYGVWPVHPSLRLRGLFELSWTVNHPTTSSAPACHPLLLGTSTGFIIS